MSEGIVIAVITGAFSGVDASASSSVAFFTFVFATFSNASNPSITFPKPAYAPVVSDTLSSVVIIKNCEPAELYPSAITFLSNP